VPKTSDQFLENRLYHERTIYTGRIKSKFIFLDTRSYRDYHHIPSVGEYSLLPYSAHLAAFIRLFCALFGIGGHHSGDVLGRMQFNWLKHILEVSDADVHVIISSIQVFTSNPVVESWGHFPRAKSELFQLLLNTNPRNLIFLSGDVHYAEFSVPWQLKEEVRTTPSGESKVDNIESSSTIQSPPSNVIPPSGWIEVTSSGLTHTCADSLLTSYLCPVMLRIFGDHRITPKSYFIGKNFGVIEIEDDERDPCNGKLTASIRDISNNVTVLSHTIYNIGCRNNEDLADIAKQAPVFGLTKEDRMSHWLPGRTSIAAAKFCDDYMISFRTLVKPAVLPPVLSTVLIVFIHVLCIMQLMLRKK